MITILQERGLNQPDKIAYTLIGEGKTLNQSITYQQLEQRVRSLSKVLSSQIKPGTPVVLIYPSGGELTFIIAFLACLSAQLVPAPAPPPDLFRVKRTLPRLQVILENLQPTAILTSANFCTSLQKVCADLFPLKLCQWLITDTVEISDAVPALTPEIDGDQVAYLQYTSGSTSTPKGVIITHNNLKHNLQASHVAAQYTDTSRVLTWMPYFHDYGLVGGLLQPLYSGVPGYVMSPLTFLKRPIRWLQGISRYQITHSAGPNFAYHFCVERTTLEERSQLNLSSWCRASTGSEPVRESTFTKFAEMFTSYGFNPCAFSPSYGLAEATLGVTATRNEDLPHFLKVDTLALQQDQIIPVSNPDVKHQVIASCGYPTGDSQVVILDPQTGVPAPGGIVGEILVSSSSVSPGYWQCFTEAQTGFFVKIDGDDRAFLKTGDLGFVWQGELFVTGRLQDTFWVKDRRYYPHLLEWTAQSSIPGLSVNGVAIFAVEIEGKSQIILVSELGQNCSHQFWEDVLIKKIKTDIYTEHELILDQVILLKRGMLPKTSSGKLIRHQLREQYLASLL